MKFTFNWLKEFVNVRQSPQKIAERLTMSGLEVESLIPIPSATDPDDWLLEVAVTPNRGDCLGILGLAREVAALTGSCLKPLPASQDTKRESKEIPIKVKVLSPRLCPRYSGRMVHGVRVAPSPPWMRSRLESCGIRSINNVVDVTNYVMLETGQPLHAFDAQRLASGEIVVRQARGSKKFVTLDEVERELAPEDLLICDGDKPVALAGIMGGKETEVQAETREVFLESAHFDPLSVRRTAKRLGLHSEASHRFERGVDREGTVFALNRAVFLLGQVAQGTPVGGIVDRYPRKAVAAPIVVRAEKVKRVLGIELKRAEMERILTALGLKIRGRSKGAVRFLPPSYRRDLTREADVIEELARLHGYGSIPSTLPLVKAQGQGDAHLRWERSVRSLLIGEGLTEVKNLSFSSKEMNRRFFGLGEAGKKAVSVLNPLDQESSEMRLSLIPGLVRNLHTHIDQKLGSFSAFELGKVFSLEPFAERQHLAGLLYGQRERKGLRATERPFTFLDVKGLIEGLLELSGVDDDAAWVAEGIASFLHPGKAASLRIGGAQVGYLGAIHPDLCEELDLPPFFIFELDFEKWVEYARRHLAVRSIPKFPAVERDLAVVVDEAFPAQRIISWVRSLQNALIEDMRVFDEYRGSPIPEGKKNLAYSISYRAENRTLTDAEVNALHQDLVSQIGQVFGAQLRR